MRRHIVTFPRCHVPTFSRARSAARAVVPEQVGEVAQVDAAAVVEVGVGAVVLVTCARAVRAEEVGQVSLITTDIIDSLGEAFLRHLKG